MTNEADKPTERDEQVGQLLRDAKELQRLATALGLPLVAESLKVAVLMAETYGTNEAKG